MFDDSSHRMPWRRSGVDCTALGREHRLVHRLGHRRMCVNRRDDVFGGGFKPLGQAHLCHQLTGIRTNDVGTDATEMIAELGLAITLEATKDDLEATIHAHPTLAEAVHEATGQAYGHAIHIPN